MTSPSTNKQSSMIRANNLVKNNEQHPEKNALSSRTKTALTYLGNMHLSPLVIV